MPVFTVSGGAFSANEQNARSDEFTIKKTSRAKVFFILVG
jgi:hypothetical protein